jgi:endo-1,4-beta-xylanase
MRNWVRLDNYLKTTGLAHYLLLHALVCLLCVCLMNSSTQGQVLQAKWVEQADDRINEIRTGGLRVIVLDLKGDPVEKCQVHVEMKRHAFPFGLSVGAKPFTLSPAANKHHETPVWRCFNAVSVDRVSSWSAIQPEFDRWDFSAIEHVLAWSEQRNLMARWGGVVTVDRGRMPKWAGALKGDALRQAMLTHAKRVIDKYGRRIDQFDLMTHTLDHRQTCEKLGIAFIRKLYQVTDSRVSGLPEAGRLGRICAHYSDAFRGERLQKSLRQITHLKESFVPVQAVAIGVQMNGSVVEAPIRRSLDWLGSAGVPVVLTGMEVAGSSPTGAAINLETSLRTMFSSSNVHGIWFSGCFADEVSNPDAALLDRAGEPTLAGAVFDNLVRKLWWTDAQMKTDQLGNVRLRVFAGLHELTATLPSGEVAKAQVFVYPGKREKLIVMQPMKKSGKFVVPVTGSEKLKTKSTTSGQSRSPAPATPTRRSGGVLPIADPFKN